MKRFIHRGALLLLAAACAGEDQSRLTAPAAGLAAAKTATSSSSISVTDLGTLGGTTSGALSLNTPSGGNRLLIVGSSADKAGVTRAAYWYVNGLTGTRQVGMLPAAASDAQSGANSVNQAEQVGGGSATTVGGLGRPVQWASTGSPASLLNISGFTNGSVLKVTPTGQGMGAVSDAGGDKPAIWDGGNLTLLPGLGGTTFIEDANVAGVIVGIGKYTNAAGGQRAVVWTNGSISQLPDGGSNSFALGINDAGIIVGMDWTSAGGSRAVRWLPPVMVGGVYIKEDLGVPGDAYDINNVGEIVGQSCVPGQICKPFYWLNGVLKYLPMLQPVRGGGARAINENGDVTGWSRLPSNYEHAVLWTHVR